LFIPLLICVVILVVLATVAGLVVFYTRERSRQANCSSALQSLPVGPVDSCNYGSMGDMYTQDKTGSGGFGEIFVKEEKTEEERLAEKEEESQKNAMDFLEKYKKTKSTEGLNIIKETKILVEDEEKLEVKSSSRENIGEDSACEDNNLEMVKDENVDVVDLLDKKENINHKNNNGLEIGKEDAKSISDELSSSTVFLDKENEKPVKTGKRVRAKSFLRSVFSKK